MTGGDAASLADDPVMAPRRVFVARPDTTVIERPGWLQLTTPSLPDGGLNEVVTTGLAPGEVDAVIEPTIAHFARAGVRWRWSVARECPELVARLIARGMVAQTVRVMVGALAPLSAPPGARVVPVGPREVETFSAVMAQGWGMRVAPVLALNRDVLAAGDPRFALFLALDGEVPAGAASSTELPHSTYLGGAVVLPPHRGRGLYRALVAARASHARSRGRTVGVVHARALTSAPILERLGFAARTDYTSLAFP